MGKNRSKATGRITLIVFPGATGKTRRLTLSHRTAKLIAAGLVLSIFVWVGSVGIALKFSSDRLIKMALIKENKKLSAEIQSMKVKFASAGEKLRRVQNYAQKLRVVADLSGSEGAPQGLISMGGPDSSGVMNAGVEEGFINENGSDWIDSLSLEDLQDNIDDLEKGLTLEEKSLADLEKYLGERKEIISSTPTIWPTRGWIASGFGYRISPFTGRRQFHSGLDIATARGTKIVAPSAGVVSFAGVKPGYGKTFVIDHGFGIKTKYGHTSEIYVSPGDIVKRGQVVARVGSTGRSTGPHLHYEVWVNGVPVDPLDYIVN